MTTIEKTMKSGRVFKYPRLTIQEFEELHKDYFGWCTACGDLPEGIDPDAHQYDCECCGEPRVYGFEQLNELGRCEFVDESAELKSVDCPPTLRYIKS